MIWSALQKTCEMLRAITIASFFKLAFSSSRKGICFKKMSVDMKEKRSIIDCCQHFYFQDFFSAKIIRSFKKKSKKKRWWQRNERAKKKRKKIKKTFKKMTSDGYHTSYTMESEGEKLFPEIVIPAPEKKLRPPVNPVRNPYTHMRKKLETDTKVSAAKKRLDEKAKEATELVRSRKDQFARQLLPITRTLTTPLKTILSDEEEEGLMPSALLLHSGKKQPAFVGASGIAVQCLPPISTQWTSDDVMSESNNAVVEVVMGSKPMTAGSGGSMSRASTSVPHVKRPTHFSLPLVVVWRRDQKWDVVSPSAETTASKGSSATNFERYKTEKHLGYFGAVTQPHCIHDEVQKILSMATATEEMTVVGNGPFLLDASLLLDTGPLEAIFGSRALQLSKAVVSLHRNVEEAIKDPQMNSVLKDLHYVIQGKPPSPWAGDVAQCKVFFSKYSKSPKSFTISTFGKQYPNIFLRLGVSLDELVAAMPFPLRLNRHQGSRPQDVALLQGCYFAKQQLRVLTAKFALPIFTDCFTTNATLIQRGVVGAEDPLIYLRIELPPHHSTGFTFRGVSRILTFLDAFSIGEVVFSIRREVQWVEALLPMTSTGPNIDPIQEKENQERIADEQLAQDPDIEFGHSAATKEDRKESVRSGPGRNKDAIPPRDVALLRQELMVCPPSTVPSRKVHFESTVTGLWDLTTPRMSLMKELLSGQKSILISGALCAASTKITLRSEIPGTIPNCLLWSTFRFTNIVAFVECVDGKTTHGVETIVCVNLFGAELLFPGRFSSTDKELPLNTLAPHVPSTTLEFDAPCLQPTWCNAFGLPYAHMKDLHLHIEGRSIDALPIAASLRGTLVIHNGCLGSGGVAYCTTCCCDFAIDRLPDLVLVAPLKDVLLAHFVDGLTAMCDEGDLHAQHELMTRDISSRVLISEGRFCINATDSGVLDVTNRLVDIGVTIDVNSGFLTLNHQLGSIAVKGKLRLNQMSFLDDTKSHPAVRGVFPFLPRTPSLLVATESAVLAAGAIESGDPVGLLWEGSLTAMHPLSLGSTILYNRNGAMSNGPQFGLRIAIPSISDEVEKASSLLAIHDSTLMLSSTTSCNVALVTFVDADVQNQSPSLFSGDAQKVADVNSVLYSLSKTLQITLCGITFHAAMEHDDSNYALHKKDPRRAQAVVKFANKVENIPNVVGNAIETTIMKVPYPLFNHRFEVSLEIQSNPFLDKIFVLSSDQGASGIIGIVEIIKKTFRWTIAKHHEWVIQQVDKNKDIIRVLKDQVHLKCHQLEKMIQQHHTIAIQTNSLQDVCHTIHETRQALIHRLDGARKYLRETRGLDVFWKSRNIWRREKGAPPLINEVTPTYTLKKFHSKLPVLELPQEHNTFTNERSTKFSAAFFTVVFHALASSLYHRYHGLDRAVRYCEQLRWDRFHSRTIQPHSSQFGKPQEDAVPSCSLVDIVSLRDTNLPLLRMEIKTLQSQNEKLIALLPQLERDLAVLTIMFDVTEVALVGSFVHHPLHSAVHGRGYSEQLRKLLSRERREEVVSHEDVEEEGKVVDVPQRDSNEILHTVQPNLHGEAEEERFYSDDPVLSINQCGKIGLVVRGHIRQHPFEIVQPLVEGGSLRHQHLAAAVEDCSKEMLRLMIATDGDNA